MADATAGAAESPRRRRWRRGGVRTRITLVATSVVAVALVLGAVGFWFTLRTSLHDALRSAAEQDAAVIAERIDADGLGSFSEPDERLVQVVDEAGTIIFATDDAPATPVADDDGAPPVHVDGETFITAVEGFSTDGVDGIVIVGRDTESADETLATVARLLWIAVPLITVLVALTAWVIVGRALSPVERMRRQVAGVTAATLAQRIDEPPADDEIGRLAHTLNGMLDRLEAAQATQRRFISDASHELKSPLAALRQYAEVARAHPERITLDELGDAVLDEGGRLERLVQGMLVLANADEGALRIEHSDVDLDDLLLDEAKRVRSAARLAVDTSGIAAARVQGDPVLLRQLVRNLVDNAARHAATGITLTVAPVADATSVVLTVSDDGDGIPADERERVFERFVRLDDARARDTGGSGLGLAIVREIVAAHGGAVRIDAGAGEPGTRMVVTLPATAGD
ncbi:ATP-binding protein [Agromyces sp. SYSU K20354]|uniref:ATP-binding protein n=1 Tax=Agromyces cavernae TaxID=2898659 RepID=UPI001E443C4A|nr:ATP-binding protein [Agromyces cavernae]MCD2441373.1 ATP-binding protein [Agromyces cavernae]